MALLITGGSTTTGVRRVIVGLKSHNSNGLTLANFMDCVVHYFNPNGVSVQLSCKLENDVLVLSPPTDADKQLRGETGAAKYGENIVSLEHSPACPLRELQVEEISSVEGSVGQGIYVGVAVILESSDDHILVTQRASHMRTFPRTWVPPGGHVEPGETLVEGGLRELREETGLTLEGSSYRTTPLCMWESVYPPFLGMGDPRNHHVVVYVHTKVEEPRHVLQAKLKLDPEEVQGCVWLSQQNVRAICTMNREQLLIDKYVVAPDGTMTTTQFDLSGGLFPVQIANKNYSGLQLALNKWLEVKNCTPKFPSKI